MPRKVLLKNTIAHKRPWLLAEWNHCVNPDPNTVGVSSSVKYLWTCMFCGESWEAKPNCHAKPGCHKCQALITSRRRSKPKPGNSLADLFPELKEEWDDDLNDRTPEEVSAHARYLAHWICPDCGFRYESYVYSRTGSGSKCPECKKKTISEKNSKPKPGTSLYDVDRRLARQLHPKKNGGLTSKDICAHSGKSVWWIGECGHEFQMAVYHRVGGDGCPICAGKQVLVGFNDLDSNFPLISSEWDETDPSGYTPLTVTQFSGKKLRWICPTHGPYVMSVVKRALRGEGCPTCAEEVRDKRIALLGQRYRKTHEQFVEEVAEKNPNIEVIGRYIDSKHAVEVRCRACDTVSMRYPGSILNGGCATCSFEKMKMSEDDFKEKLKVVNPDVKLIGEYTMASEKARFQCRKCKGKWRTVGTAILQGSGCPHCCNSRWTSFPEKAVFYYVLRKFHDTEENAHPDVDGLGRKEIDIWIPSINTAIEYDGSAWHKNTDSDLSKDVILDKAGIRVIRVREPRCPTYDTPAEIVVRGDEHTYESLDKAVCDVLDMIGASDTKRYVDTERDAYYIQQLRDIAPVMFEDSAVQMRLFA